MADGNSQSGGAAYVYAVCRGTDAPQLHGVSGMEGWPVRLVHHAELAAIVSTVDLNEFGEDALRSNLEDLTWLERTARAHHAVVEAAGSMTATAPLRLATVYHDDDRVRSLLEEQHGAFTEALSRVEGRVEWGVKVYADPETFTTAGTSELHDAPTGSGTAYLQRRRTQRHSREEAGRAAMARAEDIHAALDEVASASRRHPPQDQRLTGHSGWMILNGAYLVDHDRADDLQAAVAEFDDGRGLELELTGPWVPYSFADPEVET